MCEPDDRICGPDDAFQSALAEDYECLTETSEAFIYAAMIRLMLKRLAQVLISCISILVVRQNSIQLIAREVMSGMAFMPAAVRL